MPARTRQDKKGRNGASASPSTSLAGPSTVVVFGDSFKQGSFRTCARGSRVHAHTALDYPPAVQATVCASKPSVHTCVRRKRHDEFMCDGSLDTIATTNSNKFLLTSPSSCIWVGWFAMHEDVSQCSDESATLTRLSD